MQIVLIRHGKTAENLRGVYLGREDVPLCPQGVQELRRRTPPPVDLVASSPLGRCLESAAILYPGMQPITFPELMERDFGRFSGLTHREITALSGCADWGRDESRMEFPGGESWDTFRARCRLGFRLAVERARDKQAERLALICHGGVVMGILERYGPAQGGPFYSWSCPNGGGYLLDYRVERDETVSCVRLEEEKS